MKWKISIGSFIFCFLMLSSSFVTSAFSANIENKMNLIPTITVNGGLGIDIWIYNLDDDLAISANVVGAYLWSSYMNTYPPLNRANLHLNIIDFFGFLHGNFKLHILIENNKFSYECNSALFLFVYNIQPLDT